MANLPLSGTDIRILSGVLFSDDYKHTRWFTNETQQLNYFKSKTLVHHIEKANFQRVAEETVIVVNASLDTLLKSSYVMFQNSAYSTKWIFAFIDRIEYVQRMTTHVYIKLDVIQTFRFQMNIKPSYVIREHCKQYESDGMPVINTVDEGLDYGTDYDIVAVDEFKSPNKILYLIMISKSRLHGDPSVEGEEENKIQSSINAVPQPLCYYVHPFRQDGQYVNATVGGSDANLTSIETLLTNIYSHKSAVDNMVAIYITEHFGINPVFSGSSQMNFSANQFEKATITSDGQEGVENVETLYVKSILEYNNFEYDCGDKYDGFKPVKESKLKMYPYQMTLLTDFKGNQFEIKNEYITDSQLKVMARGSMGLSNKVAYELPYYNTGKLGTLEDLRIVGLNSAIINNNPQDVPIISDMLSAYLQGNRNSLENQQDSILFNGIMNTIGGVVGGGSQGAMVVGTTGAIGGAVQGGASGLGNTVLQLQGMQAKKQDISNTPPSLSKMGSNTAFDFGHNYSGFYIVKKQIKDEYISILEDFFMVYGYKVNKVKVPNMTTRKSYNYVQTKECNITGAFSNDYIQQIRQIFDNGITLWHIDDIGNYAVANEVK